ncbi:ATP-binding protein [Streptomyces sp. NPDC006267]|uniref:ATP-binding protein n=1 Tax=Streptomyces sp. NPDC006267 TaxID=3157173 RepID=UPI00339E4DDC
MSPDSGDVIPAVTWRERTVTGILGFPLAALCIGSLGRRRPVCTPHEAEASMRQSATAHRTPGRAGLQSRRNGPRVTSFEVPHHQPFQAAFLPEPLRVREMRRATKSFLSQHGVPGATIEDAELVVSELVTNAIQHGGGEVRFAISASHGLVRISVTDASAAPARPRHTTGAKAARSRANATRPGPNSRGGTVRARVVQHPRGTLRPARPNGARS